MTLIYTRVLRTPSSERLLLRADGRSEDAAALELHYLPGGNVSGTLIIFEDGNLCSSNPEELLAAIDEQLLPDVSIKEHNLSFTVVIGRVVGSFVPDKSRLPGNTC